MAGAQEGQKWCIRKVHFSESKLCQALGHFKRNFLLNGSLLGRKQSAASGRLSALARWGEAEDNNSGWPHHLATAPHQIKS